MGQENSNYYRENNYIYGSYCDIITSIKSWTLGNISAEEGEAAIEEFIQPERGMLDLDVRSVFRRRDGVYVMGTRGSFNREIRALFGYEEGKAICHSISSRDIDRIMESLLNGAFQIDLRQRIGSLISALCPDDLHDGERDEMLNLVHVLCAEIQMQHNDMINDTLAHLCQAMFNAQGNLRKGRADWNSFIRDCFDPKEWFHYQNQMVDGGENYMYEGYCTWDIYRQNRGYQDIPAPREEGFYLPDRLDGIRIRRVLDTGANIPIRIMKKTRYDNSGYEMETRYSILCCSSNKNPVHEVCEGRNDLQPNEENVFYLVQTHDGLIWEMLM